MHARAVVTSSAAFFEQQPSLLHRSRSTFSCPCLSQCSICRANNFDCIFAERCAFLCREAVKQKSSNFNQMRKIFCRTIV
uniref:Uncharacterized protein n=1 Tax=Anopheles quadriannulatus TaxID=34691 RepID=A0A182XTG8_ANOQN